MTSQPPPLEAHLHPVRKSTNGYQSIYPTNQHQQYPTAQYASSALPTPPTRTDTIRNQGRLGYLVTVPQAYEIGMIVSVPHVVFTMNPQERKATETKDMGHVTSKARPSLIVAIYHNSMTVLPFYSCSGGGPSKRSTEEQPMLLSIVNRTNLGPRTLSIAANTILNVDNYSCLRPWKPVDGSHVSLAEPYYCLFRWPMKTLAMLEPESWWVLVNRYKQCIDRGLVHVNHQARWWAEQQASQDSSASGGSGETSGGSSDTSAQFQSPQMLIPTNDGPQYSDGRRQGCT
ncbi:hypothetical protein OHC33_008132 [Knufia fluminis]|uniref:Uncharacterized protein n=1 Tax=Knufia fluminis TaxID=191047 RepID=A0AAN8I3V5_9EURO|nr:hypothetical protein OHC33_008132 [Knufia fluminis]